MREQGAISATEIEIGDQLVKRACAMCGAFWRLAKASGNVDDLLCWVYSIIGLFKTHGED